MKIATKLSEQGRRNLLHFLADNLRNEKLDPVLSAWEDDISWEGQQGFLEIGTFYSKTGNPVTMWFSGDDVELEDFEEDDE